MEIYEDNVPPFELTLGLDKPGIDHLLIGQIPEIIKAGNIEITFLTPPDILPADNEIGLALKMDIRYPLRIGAITGKVAAKVNFFNLADLGTLKVAVKSIDWLEGPKYEVAKGFGFSIKSVAKRRLEELEQNLGPMLEKEIQRSFVKNTQESPIYRPYLRQYMEAPKMQVAAVVKRIFYRISSQVGKLQLRFFPILELNFSDDHPEFAVEAGPFLPGVGGGLIQFKGILSQHFLNRQLKDRLKGKRFSAGNRAATIEELAITIGNEGLSASVKFEKEEIPNVSALLIPILKRRTQEIGVDIQHIKMDNSSWLIKGIFSLFRKNIENRIEDNMRLSVGELVDNNKGMIQDQIEKGLQERKLTLKEFNPALVITKLYTDTGRLHVEGQIGGVFEIINISGEA